MDDRANIADIAFDVFAQWAHEKSEGLIDVPVTGHARSSDQSVNIERLNVEGSHALSAVHHHELESGDWTLTITVLDSGSDSTHWVWVDVEHISDDAYGRPPLVAAPRTVRALIAGGHARLGPTILTDKVTVIGPSEVPALRERLFNDDRQIPIAVFAQHDGLSREANHSQASETAARLAGVASAVLLDIEAEGVFEELMPPEMAVFAGAIRLYLPGIDREDPKPWRHRWYGASKRGRRPGDVAQILAREISPRMALRRPPALYSSVFKQQIQLNRTQLFELLERREREVERLELQFEHAETRRISVLRELADEVERTLIASAPDDQAGWAEVESVEDAVAMAHRHLRSLDLTRTSVVGLDIPPPFAESRLWISRLAIGLLVLDRVGASDSEDSAAWARQYEPAGLPESMVVVRKPADSDPVLPISTRVHPSGEYGFASTVLTSLTDDDAAPVIRFLDDRRGPTGKIHIGYVGPARGLPTGGAAS